MSTIRVANAPCSWGALEFENHSVGRASRPDAGTRILTEMAAAGYEGTELGDWGLLPTEPDALAALLEAMGLSLAGAFVPVPWTASDAVRTGLRDALRVARLVAAAAPDAFLILADDNGTHPVRTARAGRIRPGDGLGRDDWRRVGAAVDEVAAAVQGETGLRVVFHHHGGGFVETPDEIARLLDATRPERLGLCLDTGHYALGGGDPVAALERFA
ncbi:MAG: TIM barrel protein, partial [Deltaproteobacteria bacterium]|nr:TIM barrel protein [Deltaproteobacteria bacterium]